jgi:hypothetical protein
VPPVGSASAARSASARASCERARRLELAGPGASSLDARRGLGDLGLGGLERGGQVDLAASSELDLGLDLGDLAVGLGDPGVEAGERRGDPAELGLGGGDRAAQRGDLALPAQHPLALPRPDGALGLPLLLVGAPGLLGLAAGGGASSRALAVALALGGALGVLGLDPVGLGAQLGRGTAGERLLDVLDEVAALGLDEVGGPRSRSASEVSR